MSGRRRPDAPPPHGAERLHVNARGYRVRAVVVTAYTDTGPMSAVFAEGGAYRTADPEDLDALADMLRGHAADLRAAQGAPPPTELDDQVPLFEVGPP